MNIALIAGTGFEKFFEKNTHPKLVNTDFGNAYVYQAQIDDISFWFLPRHGMTHNLPPHKINYRANVAALKQLGVEKCIAIFTVGSINTEVPVNSFTIADQYIDFSKRQESSFYIEGKSEKVIHMQMNQPYCETLRQRIIQSAKDENLHSIEKGTYICTNGPQLETPAEIKFYRMIGGDIVGMTGFPEVALAREANIHYASISYSVNWAAGIEKNIELVEDDQQKQKMLLIAIKTMAEIDTFEICECENPSF